MSCKLFLYIFFPFFSVSLTVNYNISLMKKSTLSVHNILIKFHENNNKFDLSVIFMTL